MNPELKHSGRGVLSTIIGILGTLLFLLAMIISILFASYQKTSLLLYIIISILVAFDIILLLLGLLLGIKGMLDKHYKHLFPILGIISNALTLFFIIGIILRTIIIRLF